MHLLSFKISTPFRQYIVSIKRIMNIPDVKPVLAGIMALDANKTD
jgi:hypothetical protein